MDVSPYAMKKQKTAKDDIRSKQSLKPQRHKIPKNLRASELDQAWEDSEAE